MPENKLSSEQNEELRVQVTLAIYQTDISTQTTTMFGASALLFAVWAIYFGNSWNSTMSYTLPAVAIFSFVCLFVIGVSRQRYTERRKQLDNLRKKYCPDAYK
jgi:hypothetical protein